MPRSRGGHRAVQQQIIVRQLQFHLTGLEHGPGRLHLDRRQIPQAFQPQGALAAQRARRRRDVQAHLAGAGHHDAHAVLEQIGADLHAEALRHGSQSFSGPGRREGHGDRLGTPQGGHHLLVDQIKKGLFGRAHAFSPVPNFYDQTPGSECCKGPNSP